jgi:hypothetical protein
MALVFALAVELELVAGVPDETDEEVVVFAEHCEDGRKPGEPTLGNDEIQDSQYLVHGMCHQR